MTFYEYVGTAIAGAAIAFAFLGFPDVREWMRNSDQRRRESRDKLERLMNPRHFNDDDEDCS